MVFEYLVNGVGCLDFVVFWLFGVWFGILGKDVEVYLFGGVDKIVQEECGCDGVSKFVFVGVYQV